MELSSICLTLMQTNYNNNAAQQRQYKASIWEWKYKLTPYEVVHSRHDLLTPASLCESSLPLHTMDGLFVSSSQGQHKQTENHFLICNYGSFTASNPAELHVFVMWEKNQTICSKLPGTTISSFRTL